MRLTSCMHGGPSIPGILVVTAATRVAAQKGHRTMDEKEAALKQAQRLYPRRRVMEVHPVAGQAIPCWAITRGQRGEWLGYVAEFEGEWWTTLPIHRDHPEHWEEDGSPKWQRVDEVVANG